MSKWFKELQDIVWFVGITVSVIVWAFTYFSSKSEAREYTDLKFDGIKESILDLKASVDKLDARSIKFIEEMRRR